MNIIRKSYNFRAFLASLGVEPVFVGNEEVSLGYRQELVGEVFENVEVKGVGQALHSFDWPDDWGPPPSESDLDAWEPEKPVEVKVLTPAERVQTLTSKFNELAYAFIAAGGDEYSPTEFLRFVLSSDF